MNEFYNEIPTEEIYKPYIQKFWILNNIQQSLATLPNYALPNGCCTIVFVSGNGLLLNLAGTTIELSAGVYLSGQLNQRVGISLKPYSKAIMAQVKPWLPSLLSNIPMDELANEVRSLEYINHSLYEQFNAIDLTNEKKVIPALYQALDPYLHIDIDARFIQWAYQRLTAGSSTSANIADLALASGYSQRWVEQKFKALVGLTAKEIQSILQLRKLIDDLSKPIYNRQLGTLALQYGYYDQSHFIRSYQRVFSEPPSKFKRTEYLWSLNGHFDFLQL